jgi:hypothetical protein
VPEVNFLVKKGLTVPKASASTPAIIFDASDPNTGIYSPGADQVAISTNGTGRLFVNASGNVGLGTTEPSTLLHLSSATGSASPTPTELRIATTTNASDWSTTDPWGRIGFYSADTSGRGPKNHAAIDVTATAGAKLLSTFNFKIAEAETGSLVDAFRLVSGNSAANVSLRMGANTNGIQFNDQTDTGINGGTQTLQFTTAGSERLRITSDGKLGLGTSSPQAVFSTKPSASTTTAATTFTGDGIYIDCANTTDSNGSYGGAISWSRSGSSTTRTVAICNVQTSSDPDVQGFAFLTHASATSTNPLIEAMRITGGGLVGIGTTSPSASALLDVSSTTQGLLPPRMTGVQRDAISSPAAGLMIYNTTTNKLNFYNGTAWEAVTSA